MKLEEIFAEWERDSKIDRTELGDESLNVPKLHHKYYRMYADEKLVLRKLESDAKSLKLEKYEFYTQGPTKEQADRGWTLPPKGMILKSDIPMYMDADRDIVELNLRIGYQQEKVELLESIVRGLKDRGFLIKGAIEWAKFTMGA